MSSPQTGFDIDVRTLLTFGVTINNFGDMWKSIFYWSLLSFGVLHLFSGLVAMFNMRHSVPLKFTWLLPIISTVLGGLIPCTAGVITATMVAGVYSTAGFEMTTTEAFAYGVGQCVVYVLSGLSRNTVSM